MLAVVVAVADTKFGRLYAFFFTFIK